MVISVIHGWRFGHCPFHSAVHTAQPVNDDVILMAVLKHYCYDNGAHTVEGFRVGRFNAGINTTFIVYRVGDTLIDCGPSNQWRFIRKELGDVDIQRLLITHHHEDHAGNASRIAEMKNLLPYAPELGQQKIATGYRTPWLQQLIWGRLIPARTQPLPESMRLDDGTEIIAVHTPGHAKDLTCLFFPQQKYLFSGDMYISRSLKMLRADENLAQLITSLETLLALDFEVLFCPHNGIVEKGKQALQDKYNNLIKLCQQAASLHRQGSTEAEIMLSLVGKEGVLAKITGGNFSKQNLIRQAIALG
ncbi:MBL fold metallo-hydrolase [Bacterioplanoides sp. SCSIO 12839]|uniref:MBL fold metallo-hydrolase n=1 Tax=Bacterioplanoides sp. SCSIO 12839 TaxID=2829569 RepID=UPI0021040A73|nr:MBL fold metallo-hydrolase [Bacterioplanoides sp. SCSIO 12839]UTW47043.1 MBL fold metallo-hydrolase [Bacterioplanoides sp. SCSIO 12839]